MMREVQAYNSLGIALADHGKFDAAAVAFKRALTLLDDRGVRANYANVLRRLWRFEEAAKEVMQADPEHEFTKYVKASLSLECGQPETAALLLEEIPDPSAHIRFCKAMAYLQCGQWQKGFEHYEARLELNEQPKSNLPKWTGQPGTVLVHHEQGFGDSLMMSRFIGNKTFSVPPPLLRLFKEGSSIKTVAMNAGLPRSDYITPLMSLPHILGIKNIEPPKPYLWAPEEYPVPKGPSTKLAVGLVWTAKANPSNKGTEETIHGWQKSIPFNLLLSLAAIPGVSLYGLQTGEAAKDIEKAGATALVSNLANAILDFADLAGFMASLDLIISVDTAPLHLAGALGKPAIGLLSYPRSWQWMTGERTAWYDSIELIAQEKPGDWAGVIERLQAKIEAML